MANPYVPQSIPPSYNQNPPPDDGSEIEDNTVRWAFVKDKIGDPLVTFAEAINAAVLAAFEQTFGQVAGITVTAASYTVQAGDQGKLVRVTGAGGVTITTPDAGIVGSPFTFALANGSASTITVTGHNTQTVDGVDNLTLIPGQGVLVFTDGTNWATTGVVPQGVGRSVTGNTSVVVGDHRGVVFVGGSNPTVTLPFLASVFRGFEVTIKSNSGSSVTINRSGSDLIDAGTAVTLPNQYDWLTLRRGDSTTTWHVSATNVGSMFSNASIDASLKLANATVTQAKVANSVINQQRIQTSTSTTSVALGAGGQATLTVNAYSFFPNIRMNGSSVLATEVSIHPRPSTDTASVDVPGFRVLNNNGGAGETVNAHHRFVAV